MTAPDDDDQIQALLDRHAREALDGPAPSTLHLDDEVLARIAEGRRRPRRRERAHLSACASCRDALGAATTAVVDARPPRSSWRRAAIPGLLAAAAGLAVFVLPQDDIDGEFRARGRGAMYADASVTVLRTDAEAKQVLEDGARVPLNGKLGFRYGNPSGEATTLTVLGYDGATVHWYYPEGPDEPAFQIAQGPEAVAQRAPFDIRLAERHHAGPLEIYAAFDVAPQALAAALRAGRPPRDVWRLRLVLESDRAAEDP